MVVYVEYVLIDNILIDYFLLKSTLIISCVKVKKGRLILLSLLGGFFSLIFPLIQVNKVITATVKILFGILLISLLKKWQNKKSFIKAFSVFLGLTFLSGGAIYGIMNLFNINPSEFFIAIVFLPVILVIKACVYAVKLIYKKRTIMSFFCDTEINVGNITVKGSGYIDSGNVVYDEGFPVIFCSKKTLRKFFEKDTLKKIKEISFSTVSGSVVKKGIISDSIKIYFNGKENIINNVRICAVDKENFNGCQFLLHPALIIEKEEIKEENVV